MANLTNTESKKTAPLISTVILAAGQGTRMKSSLSKVLHPVGGKPMVIRALQTAECLKTDQTVIVVGRDADAVRQLVGNRAQFVLQEPLLGTGHAVQQTTATLAGKVDLVVVYYADMPLLRASTIQKLIDAQLANPGPVTLLTLVQDNPRGFGRILRDSTGNVLDIIEESVATPEQLALRELNAGVYVFRADWLWEALPKLHPRAKGEYFLTDCIQLASRDGLKVVGITSDDYDELIGINTRIHLSEAETALRKRINREHMLEGVTIIDPASTYIEEEVTIGQDTIILPNTHLRGKTKIGAYCEIGPNSILEDSTIGDHCHVNASVAEGAILEDHVDIGPFAHLRKGAYLCEHVHMGNFGEVKNSRLGPHTKMGHFSYIGDANVGVDVNIGAGTITANFDGVNKNKTIIGDHAFIGSDTMLIAPVTVSENGRTAAGAVVTHDVPGGFVAVGVPARLREITPPNGKQHKDS